MTTSLHDRGLSPAVLRLASTSNRFIAVSAESVVGDRAAGHQFLLIVLPFGEIRIAEAEKHCATKLFEKLGLLGYHPISYSIEKERQLQMIKLPKLSVKLEKIQLSAFDFLFFRRIVCQISLLGTLSEGETIKRTWEARVRHTDIVKLAFRKELERALNLALEEAINDLIRHLL